MSNSIYVINHIKKRKQDLISVLGGKCCICHFDSFPEALDFHHVNAKEKSFGFSSSNGVCRNLEDQLVELHKCVLLCSNCHRGVHAGKLQVPDDW